jgi:hypothetical protein
MKSNLLFLSISLFSMQLFAQKPLNIKPFAILYSNKNFVKPHTAVTNIFAKHTRELPKNQLVNANFYANNLSFFCRQELKIAKATQYKLPIAFRLGSLQYVNYLECKPNATNY